MAQHFFMGAINKITNTYEYPSIANKINKYECPECKKDVIFKKGLIIRPYFAHKKSTTPCYYYDKPNEHQIHKDAKLLLKSLLDNKKILHFYRTCPYCYNDKEIFESIHYNENMKAVIEHRFNYNNSNKSADVALLENNEIKFIFEICYKNKTKEENRPEPWVEIDAEDLINGMNTGEIVDEENEINIKCIRNYKCYWCKLKEEKENERRIQERIEKERLIKEEKERKEIKEKKRLEKEKERFNEKIETTNMHKEDERTILEEKEIERQCKEDLQNEELKIKCNCGIQLIDLCNCKIPKFELNKLNNKYICKNHNCNKWKCRCIVSHETTTNKSELHNKAINDLHNKAKYKLVSWLKDKIPIYIHWSCCKSRYDGTNCNTSDDDTNCYIDYHENDEIIMEYKDIDNKYIADIALLNNGKIKYIFEIKFTHTTIPNVRPEPWFEISIKNILNVNMNEEIMLICLRNNKNRYCNNCRILEEEWVHNLPRLPNNKGSAYGWKQDLECIKCGKEKYKPVFVKGYRQICKLCLCIYDDELKKKYTSKCLIKIKKSI